MQASNSYTPRHLAAAHAPLHLGCRASATRRALCTAGLAVALSVVAAPGLATELPADSGAGTSQTTCSGAFVDTPSSVTPTSTRSFAA